MYEIILKIQIYATSSIFSFLQNGPASAAPLQEGRFWKRSETEKRKLLFMVCKCRNNMFPSLFHPYVSQSRWRLVFLTAEITLMLPSQKIKLLNRKPWNFSRPKCMCTYVWPDAVSCREAWNLNQKSMLPLPPLLVYSYASWNEYNTNS